MLHRIWKIISWCGLLLVAHLLQSCAGGSPVLKPLAALPPGEQAFRTELKKELSSLNVTIETTAQDLAENLNRLTPKELYRGTTGTKGLNATILRSGPIVVSIADNYLFLDMPVSIALSYSFFEMPAIATRLKFKLNAEVTPDWKIVANITFTGLSDALADDVRLGPLSFKPRSTVEGVTQPLQRLLADEINRKLNEKLALKDQVTKVWNLAHKPILLDKNYNAWLKISPQEVLLFPLYAQNNRLKLSIGIKSGAELVVGPPPAAAPPLPLPKLKMVNRPDRSFRVALKTDLYYRDILQIAAPLLLNRELGSDGKSVVLKNIDLYGNGDRLIIKIETSGSLDGRFFLTCRPVFNADTGRFSVEEVDFDLQTENLLHQSADWFLHGTIRSSIQEKLNLDLAQRLLQARQLADRAMARVTLADNVFLTGSIKAMQLNDVLVQKDRLSIQLYTEGETLIAFK